MKKVYLSNGQQANLVEELPNNRFLVEPAFEYETEYGTEDCWGSPIIVEKIYDKAPIAKIASDFKAISENIVNARGTLATIKGETLKAKSEFDDLMKSKSDFAKWHVDLSKFRTAKRIVFFVKNIVQPCVIENAPKNKSYTWQLNFSVSVWDAGIVEYTTGFYMQYSDEYRKDFNKNDIDAEYGYMFDLTDEELIVVTNNRSETLDLSNLHYMHKGDSIPAQYRTPRILKFLEQEEAAKKHAEIQGITKQILDMQERLANLQA